jgi:hypothetical protein
VASIDRKFFFMAIDISLNRIPQLAIMKITSVDLGKDYFRVDYQGCAIGAYWLSDSGYLVQSWSPRMRKTKKVFTKKKQFK